MAITQISRIQLRRGRKLETGLPQLASAEMAWAVDTRELFIGNGSVKEGASAVGNTKILTEHDDLLDIAQSYQYKKLDGSIWNVLEPVLRSLQDRLDDRVTNLTFDIKESGSTEQFQKTIDVLYDNIIVGRNASITLNFLPGTYIFTAPIKLPAMVSIVGSGIDHTILNFNITDVGHAAIETKEQASYQLMEYDTSQPKFCALSDFTLRTTQSGFKLNSVRDSVFENIRIEYDGADSGDIAGVVLDSMSAMVKCERNIFRNIHIKPYGSAGLMKYGIHAVTGALIVNNTFDSCNFERCQYGIVVESGTSTLGVQGGANQNTISNSIFTVSLNAIKIITGSGNVSSSNKFYCITGTFTTPPVLFPLAQNGKLGNVSSNDYMDQPPSTGYFPPMVTGDCDYVNSMVLNNTVSFVITTTALDLYRLPAVSSASIIVDYTMTTSNSFRKGKLEIVLNGTNNSVLDVIDDYTVTGTTDSDSAIISGIVYSAAIVSNNIVVRYVSSSALSSVSLKYTYRIS